MSSLISQSQLCLTEIAAKLYYQTLMPLPNDTHQTIEQIISATDGVSPDLYQYLYDELVEQFEQILAQAILKHLEDSSAIQFNNVLNTQTVDVNQIQEFMAANFDDMNPVLNESIATLKNQYLDR